MKELIKITQHNGNSFISARELHKFLEVGKVFGAWINERIEQFEFIENQDYVVFFRNWKKPKRRTPNERIPSFNRYGKRTFNAGKKRKRKTSKNILYRM